MRRVQRIMLWFLRHSHWWERPARFVLGRRYQRIKDWGWSFYYWAAVQASRGVRNAGDTRPHPQVANASLDSKNSEKIRGRKPQFGLRTLMLLVALIAVLLWAGQLYWRSREVTRIARYSDFGNPGRGELPLEPEAVPLLIRGLQHRDVVWRREAAEKLRYMGTWAAPATDALRMALTDSDPQVRKSAAAALGNIGPRAADAVPDLLGLLRESKYELRYTAVRALDDIHGRADVAVPALVEMVTDENEYVRMMACHALGTYQARSDAAIAALTAALDDPVAGVRIRAAQAITELPTDCARALAVLIEFLSAGDVSMCNWAARILGDAGPRAEIAVPDLIAILHQPREPNTVVLEALGKIGPGSREAVPEIMRALQHEVAQVRLHAACALNGIGSQADASVAVLIELLDDTDLNVRLAACEALGSIGLAAKAAVPALTEMLKSDDELAQRMAADSLTKIDVSSAKEAGAPE